MPLYEYECTSCEHRTEVIQRFSDEPLEDCPECGALVKRLISAPAVQFKGTGWYVTDYGGRKSSEPSSEESKSDGKSESKAVSGKSEVASSKGGAD